VRQLSCCSFCRSLYALALMFPPKLSSHTHTRSRRRVTGCGAVVGRGTCGSGGSGGRGAPLKPKHEKAEWCGTISWRSCGESVSKSPALPPLARLPTPM
jgi:hypothetical protein